VEAKNMHYRAMLVPDSGDRTRQIFSVSLEEAKKWARRTLWDCHRKLVQNTGPGMANREPPYAGPRVTIQEYKPVDVSTVYPWDVTDEDKKDPVSE